MVGQPDQPLAANQASGIESAVEADEVQDVLDRAPSHPEATCATGLGGHLEDACWPAEATFSGVQP